MNIHTRSWCSAFVTEVERGIGIGAFTFVGGVLCSDVGHLRVLFLDLLPLFHLRSEQITALVLFFFIVESVRLITYSR